MRQEGKAVATFCVALVLAEVWLVLYKVLPPRPETGCGQTSYTGYVTSKQLADVSYGTGLRTFVRQNVRDEEGAAQSGR